MVHQGGALGAIAGDQVISAVGGCFGFHGANGNHKGVVAGSADGGIALGVGGVVAAVISGGNHYHNSGLVGGFDGLAQGILCPGFVDIPAQGQVDDADIVSLLQFDGRVDGGDHRGIRSRAGFVQGPQVDQIYPGSDALVLAAGVGAVAADDAGHMRAVAVEVVCAGANKVLAIDYAAG